MKAQITILLAVALLLSSVDCQQSSDKLEDQVQEVSKTILLANHFYSEEVTSTIYHIADLSTDKPLIFYLKSQDSTVNDKFFNENPIQITFEGANQNQTCQFTSYYHLCSLLPEIASTEFKLTAACSKVPCDINWVIVQPHQPKQKELSLESLLPINQNSKHAILLVNCDNPELRPIFGKDIHLYSNSHFKKVIAPKGPVFFLFSNSEKGYYYITTDNDSYRSCAKANIHEMKEEIDFSKINGTIYDFVAHGETNKYKLNNVPDSDFRIEFFVSDINHEELTSDMGLHIGLIGYKQQVQTNISFISLMIEDQKSSLSFSHVFKKLTEKFDRVELAIKGIKKILAVQMRFVVDDVHDIELGQQSFFDLKKGDKIKFNLIPLSGSETIDKIFIFTSDEKLFETNVRVCRSDGCQFTVQALEAGRGNVYIGVNDTRNTNEIIVEDFKTSVSRTIREGEYFYYSYKMQPKNAFQLIVNSPSVLVYAASKSKCQMIDEKNCYEKAFTSHHPAIYNTNNEETLIFKVIGLDNCDFTLAVLNTHSRFLILTDGIPFTYVLTENDKQMLFFFKLKQKEDVSFNLIAPVNELDLFVVNKEVIRPQDQRIAQLSSNGFIAFNKEDVKYLEFGVKVGKRQEYIGKHIHFTLIASTKQVNLRLQPGIAHYQTLKPKSSRDYVFEFQSNKTILLNFYTHNIKQNVKVNLMISNADSYSDKDKMMEFTIDREVDVLDIGLLSKKLCMQGDGENCQLFLRLENLMEIQADITLTLMVQNSIIELKDGIWQEYGVNAASARSHFYFWPKHQNQSTTIFYKSSLVDIQMIYLMWKCEEKSIDISQWPFPLISSSKAEIQKMQFRPTNFIRIESEAMKSCWPYCVVLISIKPNVKSFKSSLRELIKKNSKTSVLTHQQFKIMASNNYIELPEKHRVDIAMTDNEEKKLLVNLKYLMDKEILNFDKSVTTGNVVIKANVYSQKNPQCPIFNQTADFKFDYASTQIAVEDIRRILATKSMEKDQNLYLCLLAKVDYNTKFSIEFNSQVDDIKTLSLDSSITLRSQANQITFWQLDVSQQFELKINTIRGYLYMWSKRCKLGKQLAACLEEFRNSSDRGIPLKDKINEVSFDPCQKCRLFIKFTSVEPSKVILYTVSKYAEVELLEGHLMSDDLDINEQNRYILTSFKTASINIHLNIISGNVRVQVHDFDSINITNASSSADRNIHIVIPPRSTPINNELNTTQITSEMPAFQNIHVAVQSQNSQEKAVYSITYTTQTHRSSITLQAGLITEYTMVSKKITYFLYSNPANQTIYLHISTINPQVLNNLNITIFTIDQVENKWVRMTPQIPNFHQKTPNPTMLMQLPAKNKYYVEVNNSYDKNFILKIGVNNRQIISLPFNHDFPVQLNQSEHIFIVLSPTSIGYVKLTLSKCDISQPLIAYTFKYKQFAKNDFAVQQQMSDQLTEEIIIKVSTPGSLYLKIKSPDNDKSLMSIKATFSQQKYQAEHNTAGDNGIIQYQLLDSTKAELTITGLACGNRDKDCGKDFSFSAVSSNRIQSVYAQLVCPSITFDLFDFQQIKSADLTPIPSSSVKYNNKMTFTQSLSGDIVYVGVKAVNQKTGEVVYYRPVEIVTFWGQMNRTSSASIAIGVILGVAVLVGGYCIYRGWKRKEYRPLGMYE